MHNVLEVSTLLAQVEPPPQYSKPVAIKETPINIMQVLVTKGGKIHRKVFGGQKETATCTQQQTVIVPRT